MKVLVTGASGKVGRHAVRALVRRGAEVIATDLVRGRLPEEMITADRAPGHLPRGVAFRRCDLTDETAVGNLIRATRPDVVVHAAAVVGPLCYGNLARAEAVNLGATQHLLEAVQRHAPDAFLIFTSSYAVFGPCSPADPHRNVHSPLRPAEPYAQHKATVEQWLRDSPLRYCVLRLGAVFEPFDLMPRHPSYRPFVFMVPLEQPEHGVDVRDVAHAIASAAERQPDGQVFLIGGDDDWKRSARFMREQVLGALGIAVPPDEAFRSPPRPADREGWFYECWMDTAESEATLRFHQTRFATFLEDIRRKYRFHRWALRPLAPLVQRTLLRASPYVGPDAIRPGATVWDDTQAVFGLTPLQSASRPV